MTAREDLINELTDAWLDRCGSQSERDAFRTALWAYVVALWPALLVMELGECIVDKVKGPPGGGE